MPRITFIGNCNPKDDGLNGSFHKIIKKSPNLKENFLNLYNETSIGVLMQFNLTLKKGFYIALIFKLY